MALTPGARLGVYEIVGALGAGSTGEVYLPATFSSDPDRLMRFEREARTLASLNHPHIAQISGVEGKCVGQCVRAGARDGTGRGRGSVGAAETRTNPARRGVAARPPRLPRRWKRRTTPGSSIAI